MESEARKSLSSSTLENTERVSGRIDLVVAEMGAMKPRLKLRVSSNKKTMKYVVGNYMQVTMIGKDQQHYCY